MGVSMSFLDPTTRMIPGRSWLLSYAHPTDGPAEHALGKQESIPMTVFKANWYHTGKWPLHVEWWKFWNPSSYFMIFSRKKENICLQLQWKSTQRGHPKRWNHRRPLQYFLDRLRQQNESVGAFIRIHRVRNSTTATELKLRCSNVFSVAAAIVFRSLFLRLLILQKALTSFACPSTCPMVFIALKVPDLFWEDRFGQDQVASTILKAWRCLGGIKTLLRNWLVTQRLT